MWILWTVLALLLTCGLLLAAYAVFINGFRHLKAHIRVLREQGKASEAVKILGDVLADLVGSTDKLIAKISPHGRFAVPYHTDFVGTLLYRYQFEAEDWEGLVSSADLFLQFYGDDLVDESWVAAKAIALVRLGRASDAEAVLSRGLRGRPGSTVLRRCLEDLELGP